LSTTPETISDSGTERQRYQIIEQIDRGGMAEIFLGKAHSIQGIEREVAIKRVLPELTRNEQFVEMFLDEARLSMRLNHANIVQIFDVGCSAGTYFLVMEYVDGHNLRRLFEKASAQATRVPLELACHLLMEVCKGLAHAHERTNTEGEHLQIVHRDLSPPNILVSKDGQVKITDFGLAKALTHVGKTEPGFVKGKFSYLSPEAADGKVVDHRADIFACAVCLWELLANRRLFLGRDDLETIEMVRKTKVPSLSSLHPQVTPEFDQILQRALHRDPKKRYTSARELGDALAQYLFAHNLKVTSYDLASLLRKLFDEEGVSVETTEARISGLIQDEILSLSMLGQLGESVEFDGSRPIAAESLGIDIPAKFNLDEFWSGQDIFSAVDEVEVGGPSHMEGANSPSDLLRMLEGKEHSELSGEILRHDPDGAGWLAWVGFLIVGILVGLGGFYFIAPDWLAALLGMG
jgi:serine/threonine protein kinase